MRGPGGPPSLSPQVPPRALQRDSGVPREGAGQIAILRRICELANGQAFFRTGPLAIPVDHSVRVRGSDRSAGCPPAQVSARAGDRAGRDPDAGIAKVGVCRKPGLRKRA